MIYTVTFNPVLETMLELDEIVYDDVNKIHRESKYVHGKGIDVSRVIKEIGGESIACGFLGGCRGSEIERKLRQEGIACDFEPIAAESSSRIAIFQKKKRLRTVMEVPVKEYTSTEKNSLLEKLLNVPPESFVVISGNISKQVGQTFCAEITETLRKRDIKVVLDADGEDLKLGIEAQPYMVKPNLHEFRRLIGRNVTEIEDIIRYAQPYTDKVRFMVISMGAKGVVGVSREECFHVIPPKIAVRSSFGAGDSLIGGMVHALHQNASFKDALTLGVACGAASVINPENVLYRVEDVNTMIKAVLVEEIKKTFTYDICCYISM